MRDLIGRAQPRLLPFADDGKLNNMANGLLIATLIIAGLYFGRAVFEPLAIAILLSLILTPVIVRLRGWGLNRAVSVIMTVFVAIGALGALGYTMSIQVADLAGELPHYEANLREKALTLRGRSLSSGALDKASGTLEKLQKEIATPEPSGGAARPSPSKPVLVEVREPPPSIFESYRSVVEPLISPLATTGLVIMFLVFILLQREDIRDRVLRLAGTRDLQRTTMAMDDAAVRLSQFFLLQTALNASFGVIAGAGLWIIGVPSPMLWGILAALMRFVPYIGSFIAAAFPIAIAAAVDPGWTMVLATAALFLVLETLVGQIVEPMVYGHSTGLSPAAVVIATLFWTLLWGPIGLLLAMPLTLCLVVLGKHIEALSFIDILLGDEPALAPEESFYQRVLAGDATEAAEQAEEQLKTRALSSYYDAVPMMALALAQNDAAEGKLSREKQLEMRDTFEEIVEDLSDYADETPLLVAKDDNVLESGDEKVEPEPEPPAPVINNDELTPEWRIASPVLCIASRSPLDQCAAIMLAQLLQKHGIEARVQPFSDITSSRGLKVDVPDARIVCLSYFGQSSKPAHVRYLIRRLRSALPEAKFLACFWLLEKEAAKVEGWKAAVGADFVATSLVEATAVCVNEAMMSARPSAIPRVKRSEAESKRESFPAAAVRAATVS